MKLIHKYHLKIIIRHRVFSRVDGWHTYFYPVVYSLPVVKGSVYPRINEVTFMAVISRHDFCTFVDSYKPYCAFLVRDGCAYALPLYDRYRLFRRKIKTRGKFGSFRSELQYSSDYDYVHLRNGFDA